MDPSMNDETIKVPITCLKLLDCISEKCFDFWETTTWKSSSKISWVIQTIPNPIFKTRFDKPDDGLPCIEDWVGTFESILFGGLDLGREPLDGSVAMQGGTGFLNMFRGMFVTKTI